jgi:hypothetical protein
MLFTCWVGGVKDSMKGWEGQGMGKFVRGGRVVKNEIGQRKEK